MVFPSVLTTVLKPALVVPAALLLGALAAEPARAHGTAGGVELPPGQFRITPLVTIEAHGGLENNLPGQPSHYAIDGLFGVAMEWGLANRGSLAIEAMLGPALVWGEAEHFYGRVERPRPLAETAEMALSRALLAIQKAETLARLHAEEAAADEAGHDEAGHTEAEPSEADHAEGHDHADEDVGHGHGGGAPFRRTDIKGQLQIRYAPNERLALVAEWKPYYVTSSQGEDINGVKNELGVELFWALGDGDVNFALGDGLEEIVNGLFISVKNRSGWESDGTYIGNYTDPWLGVGFKIDRLNITLSGGPRFYSPGSYSGLSGRTDWGGEIELELPISRRAVLFAHWRPIYSTDGGPGWGVGWQNHIGTGVTYRF